MPRMRRVVLTVEVTTCATIKELRNLQALVLTEPGQQLRTIRKTIVVTPMRGHRSEGCMGRIEQVQANVIRN